MGAQSLVLNKTEFYKNLAYTKKIVTFFLWPFVMKAINEANNVIANDQPVHSKRRICYVGKRIIPSGETYFGFAPPGSDRLLQAFYSTFETGLYYYWMTEFLKMTYASRVQDRNKVVSPTQIKDDFVNIVSKLRMEGKILTVFFLWGVCLMICVISFGIEFMYFAQMRNKVVYYA